jgi:hypothetical protein
MSGAVRCSVVITARSKHDGAGTRDVVGCRDSGLIRYYSRLVPEHVTFRYSSVRANVCQTEDLTGTSAFMMY